MKLTSVELLSSNLDAVDPTDKLVFSFRDPTASNPFNIKGIDGLDADGLFPKNYSSSSSAKFHNLAMQKRDVVLKVGLNPDFSTGKSYSDLRDLLYKNVAKNRRGLVQLRFKNRLEVVAAVSGTISKIEAPLFEQTQEVKITINTNDPMLKGLVRETFDYGAFDSDVYVLEDDKSSAPHGFIFAIQLNWPLPALVITDPSTPGWSFTVAPSGGFFNDDKIYFSSEFDNKYIYYIRDPSPNKVQVAEAIAPGSIWPILFPGRNTFQFEHPIYFDWLDLRHYPTYWGV